jgi:hypothetical protein
MKYKIIILILIIFSFLSCNEKDKQTEIIDTAIIESNIEKIDTLGQDESEIKLVRPKGNQLFNKSVKLRHLKIVDGYDLKSINVKSCDESLLDEPNIENDYKINRITINDESFKIDFSIIENCCSEFLCEAEIIDESTLNIIYHSFGNQCSCNCQFDIEYNFSFDK